MSRKPFLSFLLIILASLLLTACSANPDRLWLKAPGWSRAILVGNTRVGDQAPFARDAAGNLYFLIIAGEDDRYYPRVVAMAPDTAVLWDRSYDEIAITRPDQPGIFWDGEKLLLFWLNNEQLTMATVDPTNGLMPEWPQRLSDEHKVGNYSLTQRSDGKLVLWYAGSLHSPGLYAFAPGDFSSPATLIDPEGVRPQIAFDKKGTLHVVWAHMISGDTAKPIFYAAYANGEVLPDRQQKIAEPLASASSVVNGPVLGLDADLVYIFWSIEVRTGISAGSVKTAYVTFPLSGPQGDLRPQDVRVPSLRNLPYEPVTDSPLRAVDRVILDRAQLPMTGQVTALDASQNSLTELVVAHRVRAEYLMRKDEMQVGTLFFRDGVPHSYQLLSFTAGDSRSPFLRVDDEGQLYLSWLERGNASGFLVYFTSTSPVIQAATSSLTQDDVGRLTASTLFGLLSGMLLLPLALMWFAPPLFLIAITSPLRRGYDSLRHPGTLISLTLSIASYWITKLIFLPGIRDYVPFTAWIPIIPHWMYEPLRLGMPVLISLIALWVARHFTYQRQHRSPLYFLLIFLAVDGVLTTAIYGVIFLATT